MDGAIRRGLPYGLGLVALATAHRLAFMEAFPGQAVSAIDRALYEPSMASPLLALAAASLLAFRRREAITRALREGEGRIAGLLPLLLGAALLLWSRQLALTHLVLPSLLLSLVGAALAVGGSALLRPLAWPLAALALATPLPPAVLHALVFPLQGLTVELGSLLLAGLGRAHEVRGDLILDRGAVFQVIEGCSGFKSIVSLLLAAIVYADLVLTRQVARLALVAAAIPVAIGVNALRVLALVLGRVPSESTTHTVYGVVAVVGGVFVLALVELTASRLAARTLAGRATARSAASRRNVPSSPPASRTTAARDTRRLRLVVLGVLLATACGAEWLPRRSWPLVRSAVNIETLPESIAGRTARVLPADGAFLGTVAFGHQIHRGYAAEVGVEAANAAADAAADAAAVVGDGDADAAAHGGVTPAARGADPASRSPDVRVFIGHEDVSRADRSGWSMKTVMPGSGWLAMRRLDRESDSAWARWTFRYPDRRVLVAHRRVGYAPWGLEVLARWLGLDRLGLLGYRRSPLVMRIEVDERAGGEARARVILRQFESAVDAWVRAANG